MLKIKSDINKNCLLIILFISFLTTNSEQIKIPIKLINTTFSKYSSVKQVFIKVNSLLKINIFNSIINKFLQNQQQTLNCKVEILNSFLFAAEIEIGSNSQKFNVILDTGSQILWVPENNSISSNKTKNFYKPSISKTSLKTKMEFEVLYVTGYCQGYYYKDLLKFLSKEQYYLYFGSANYSVFEVKGADGILGLSRIYQNNSFSPLFTLKDNGIIPSASFSFKYNSLENNLFMYVGKQHKDFDTENIAFCNLTSNNYYEKVLWACRLNSFGFIKNITNIKGEDNIFINSNISVIFDTGTNFIFLPYELLFPLTDKIKNNNCLIGSSDSYSSDEASFFVICFDIEKIPDISLQFNEYILILSKYKMFFMVDFGFGITGYLLNIQFQRNLVFPIIGQNFFTEFHTLFDPENKVIKFYSEKKDKIIYLQKSNEKNGSNVWLILIFIIIIVLIFAFFYYRNQRKKMVENNYEWMGKNDEINFKYNNIQENN